MLRIRLLWQYNIIIIYYAGNSYLDNKYYAETSCSLIWITNSELHQYNDSTNLTLKTDCSHDEFTYYSFKQEGWCPLNELEPAADQSISYTNHSTNREDNDIDTNKCVYHIHIQMTEEMHEHLQGVVFIRSFDQGYCYPFPRRYNIIAPPQPKCNCNQETTGQTSYSHSICKTGSSQETTEHTTATASAVLDQKLYLMTSSSCDIIIIERMLPLFCSLICLIFIIALNNLLCILTVRIKIVFMILKGISIQHE